MNGTVARYDLSKRNLSFDFYVWQTHAYLLGAREIVFKLSDGYGNHKVSMSELIHRYQSIIRPGPAFLGLPSRVGDDGEECATHKLYGIIQTGITNFPRLKSVRPPRFEKYTVTLRNCPKHAEQNSETTLWREFAERIKAHVIEDYYDKPIEIEDRMALYAGARMNFGVVNGPMALLYLSNYPMTLFNCDSRLHQWEKHGVPRGTQLPFARPNQRLVWEKPDIQMLMKTFEETYS